MFDQLKYTSSIKDMPFMFSEMRRTAQLICDGKSKAEIINMSIRQNIYQLNREKRRRELPASMIRRLKTINAELLKVIAYGNDSEAKLIAFLALIKTDRLLFEYMREVYTDQYYFGTQEITDHDFTLFIERKSSNSPVISRWADKSITQIRNTYKRILSEAQLAQVKDGILVIQKPIVEPTISNLLISENPQYLKALLLEVNK